MLKGKTKPRHRKRRMEVTVLPLKAGGRWQNNQRTISKKQLLRSIFAPTCKTNSVKEMVLAQMSGRDFVNL